MRIMQVSDTFSIISSIIVFTFVGRSGKHLPVASHGHRPVKVIVKRAVIGSKGGWKLSTIFLSCKVFHYRSIIKLRKYIVFIRRVYLCCTF